MELHPCSCGEEVFEWSRHRLEQRENRLVSVYEGTCGRCGTSRRFEFEVTDEVSPPPAYGGATPSKIIDPGEFLTVSQRAAADVPADPRTVDSDDLDDAYDGIEIAVAALDEVLKFVPPGAAAVPAEAFTSDLGRKMYASDPGQFDRDRLTVALAEYARIRSAYASAVGE
jgi:hypothetical protein